MTMLYQSFATVLAWLAMASARDSKFMKTVPTISNSLVNLGKMDISFYFSGKHADNMQPKSDHSMHSELVSPQTVEQGCACNNFQPGPSFLSNPAEIINKILKSNDLFKNPSSSLCCDSHEHMQESTVIFEVSPNRASNFNAPRNLNSVQLPLNSAFHRGPLLPFYADKVSQSKPKAVEILLFPRRKDMATFEFTNLLSPKKRDLLKPNIQVVGDKEISFKPSTSVKKDLTVLEKNSNPEEQMHTNAPLATKVNNVL